MPFLGRQFSQERYVLKNLTEEELGLLLWAIRLEKNSQMNIGKAKAYGYGRVSVVIKSAKKIDLQKSYKEGYS